MKLKTYLLSALLLGGLTAAPAFAGGDDHDHEAHTDFEVGLNIDGSGNLTIAGDEDLLSGVEFIELEPGSGFFSGGFAEAVPGFEAVEVDEPGEILAIDTSMPHQISLERVSFSTGFEMYDAPFSQILTADGMEYQFIQEATESGFHNDLLYANFGNLGDTFSATYFLTDASGTYGDSAPFTLNFVNVPEPATAALLLMGTVAVVRRRR